MGRNRGGEGKGGADVLLLLGKVCNKAIKCEEGRGGEGEGEGGRREENMGNSFLRLEEELIWVR